MHLSGLGIRVCCISDIYFPYAACASTIRGNLYPVKRIGEAEGHAATSGGPMRCTGKFICFSIGVAHDEEPQSKETVTNNLSGTKKIWQE